MAPEFKDVDGETLDAFLSDAALELNPETWGTKFEAASVYLAAHNLALAKRGIQGFAGGGPVSSQGGTSVGFGTSEGEPLKATPYGFQLLRLRRGAMVGPLTSRD